MICNVCGREIEPDEAIKCPVCEETVCQFCYDEESCDKCNGSNF